LRYLCNCLLVDIDIPVMQKQKKKGVNQRAWFWSGDKKNMRITDDETADSVVKYSANWTRKPAAR